jgi:hypothetical protein
MLREAVGLELSGLGPAGIRLYLASEKEPRLLWEHQSSLIRKTSPITGFLFESESWVCFNVRSLETKRVV